jgi:hypothetical protein
VERPGEQASAGAKQVKHDLGCTPTTKTDVLVRRTLRSRSAGWLRETSLPSVDGRPAARGAGRSGGDHQFTDATEDPTVYGPGGSSGFGGPQGIKSLRPFEVRPLSAEERGQSAPSAPSGPGPRAMRIDWCEASEAPVAVLPRCLGWAIQDTGGAILRLVGASGACSGNVLQVEVVWRPGATVLYALSTPLP